MGMTSNKIATRRGKAPRVISHVSEAPRRQVAGAGKAIETAAIAVKESETMKASGPPNAKGSVYVDLDRIAQLLADLILATLSQRDVMVNESADELSIDNHSLLSAKHSNKELGV